MIWDGVIHWFDGVLLLLFFAVLFHRSENKDRLQKEKWSNHFNSPVVSKEVKGVIPPFCKGARSRDFKRPWPAA